MKLTLVGIFFSFLFFIQAQNNNRLDSLLNISKKQKNLELIETLNEISWEFRNIQLDSAVYYANKSLKLSKNLKSDKAIALSYHNMAAAFEAKGYLDSAEVYHKKSLRLRIKVKDTIGIADSYNNLGILEDTKGNYDLALKNYFSALKIYEAHTNDFEKTPAVLINIGIVYKKQKEYQKVLNYYQKALKIYQTHNYKIGETIITGNIGSVLISLKEYKKSIQHSEKAQKLYSQLGYTRYIPYMTINIGVALDSLKQHSLARQNFLSAISGFNDDSNLYELSNAKIALANNYKRAGEFILARSELLEALKICDNSNFKEFKVRALQLFAQIDAATNNFKNAYQKQVMYSIVKDSLYESDKAKSIAEIEAKYQTEKKEKEILSQRADIAEKELHINQKNTEIIGLGILAIVISILGYLLYNQQKLKNQQLKKESELKEALIKIENQNKLQEQRLNISRDLHDNIGAQLTFIISSIDNLQYGFKITNEKLNNKLLSISTFTKETIYELRDTIWAMNKNDISLEDLQIRISNFINNGKVFSKGIDFSHNFDTSLSEALKFTSLKGMHIYRIVQEAINNAIKYAEATKINVEIKKIDTNIEFSIIDNGKGFNLNTIKFGNGINNMNKRALDIGAELSIKSEENFGTSIVLLLNN